jgi:hypothetical protein
MQPRQGSKPYALTLTPVSVPGVAEHSQPPRRREGDRLYRREVVRDRRVSRCQSLLMLSGGLQRRQRKSSRTLTSFLKKEVFG